MKSRKRCAFCVDRTKVIDYKNAGLLRPYLTQHARIRPRRRTGTCAKHQRQIARAIKRARHLALLPISHEHVRSHRG
ncbi:MAG: 30S ribosomal protein S18 [Anaerolineae bacterium]|nr:30S ribosomal protein S18 [Anaerolineae bacterium]